MVEHHEHVPGSKHPKKPEQGETSGKARKSEQSDLTKNEMTKWASRIGKTSLAVLVAVGLLAAK
jgi:hypothetical protein